MGCGRAGVGVGVGGGGGGHVWCRGFSLKRSDRIKPGVYRGSMI